MRDVFDSTTFPTNLQQYGEIEDCQMEDSSLSAIITYKSRAEAEQVLTYSHTCMYMYAFMWTLYFHSVPQAAIHGIRLNNQELRLAWHKPTASLNTTDLDEAEPEDEEVRPSSLFT